MKQFRIIFLLTFFSLTNVFAQKTNAEKIVGCWILKKIEFNSKDEFSEELIKDSKNSRVCFDSSGKFVTTKENETTPIEGSYKVLSDDKTITQTTTSEDNVNQIEIDAQIVTIDDKNLSIKMELGIIYFERE
ncbi:hypothetical protein [Flavobacterium sp.]|uniref:hypothetical protein n=1 Tax=Flavobacterium sp. TaxID=239 RepID=UPI002611C768|nr:hypothetical protein [Flavobacterium sp.]